MSLRTLMLLPMRDVKRDDWRRHVAGSIFSLIVMVLTSLAIFYFARLFT